MAWDNKQRDFLRKKLSILESSLTNYRYIGYVNWREFSSLFDFPTSVCADVCDYGWDYSHETDSLKKLIKSFSTPFNKTLEDYL